jgi:hypothetical protein
MNVTVMARIREGNRYPFADTACRRSTGSNSIYSNFKRRIRS